MRRGAVCVPALHARAAWSEIRDYAKTLATADAMETRNRAGDDHYDKGALAPVPGRLRAFVAREQGNYQGALMMSSGGNDFYLTYVIEVDMALGIASALLGDDAEAAGSRPCRTPPRVGNPIQRKPCSAIAVARWAGLRPVWSRSDRAGLQGRSGRRAGPFRTDPDLARPLRGAVRHREPP